MKVLLYPRVSAPDRLRVWAAVTECNQAPALEWRVDGQALAPQHLVPLRPIQPVRADALVANSAKPRVYSGLYEVSGVSADASHQISVSASGYGDVCIARSLPTQVPDEGFHILLSSCFHVTEADAGGIEATVDTISSRCRLTRFGRRPDLALFMGDQVYLDLPTLQNFPNDMFWLASNFEEKYRSNWLGNEGGKNFHQVLAAAPGVFLADDHEFWNNYPHRSPFIQNSWTARGRQNWGQAAKALFQGFQESPRPEPGDAVQIEVPPVSFFVADTRTARGSRKFMTPRSLEALRQWSKDLDSNGFLGVFVSGQSMYAEKPNPIEGSAADWELPNYDDYGDVAQALLWGRQPIICVTGDVHWGRVIRSTPVASQNLRHLYEVIVSPLALVTSVGKDQVSGAANWFRGLFGRDRTWYRHSDPKTETGPFGDDVVGRRIYQHEILGTLKGDQMGLLSFGWHSGRLTAQVRVWNVGRSPTPGLDCTLF